MTITIMQWNIWYLEDIAKVAAFIKEQAPDIVCLQEMTIGHPLQLVKDAPAYIAEQLDYQYYAKELPIEATDGTKITLANGIFSRFPLSGQRFAWINQPQSGGGYADELRAYVESVADVDGTALTIGCTHMSYTDRFKITAAKKRETNLLLAELRKPRGNLVFCGDLNATPESDTIKRISKLLKNAGPDDNGKTWTTKPFSYNGFEADTLDWRLDYIFTSQELTTHDARVVDTELSDHLPVMATITL